MSCRCLEPGWFVGDPTLLARENTIHCSLLMKFARKLIHGYVSGSCVTMLLSPEIAKLGCPSRTKFWSSAEGQVLAKNGWAII